MENQSKSKKKKSVSKKYFVHESSLVDKGARVGQGTKIWHFSHINSGARIGKDCVIGQNVFVGAKSVIGNGVRVQNNVSIYEGVILEDFVFCGPSMVFTNVINPRSFLSRKHEFKKTLVKKGATIGANATIICGNTIGRYAFLGAGTIITKNVPDYGLVVGNPGRLIGYMCECGLRLKFKGSRATCSVCKSNYSKTKGMVKKLK